MNIISRISDYIISSVLGFRIPPKTLQLPITSYCNSRCTTCNVWKLNERNHLDANQLRMAFADPYFSKVQSVGVNGGEPSLNKEFVSIIEAISCLPSIKEVYVISNGMVSDLLLSKMKTAMEICKNKGISLHLTISLDGTRETDNLVRGVKDAYDKTLVTIKHVSQNKKLYCDYFDVGYTISKRNASDMVAVRENLKSLGVKAYFHIAVPNKRIHTFDDYDYSVINDKRAAYLAREFFYSDFIKAKDFKTKIKSFMNFYYLWDMDNIRLASCNYLHRDITIDENLNVYLCATASDCVGNLTRNTLSELKKGRKLDAQVKNVQPYCKHCIHYAFAPTFKGLFFFLSEVLSKGNLVIDVCSARLGL